MFLFISTLLICLFKNRVKKTIKPHSAYWKKLHVTLYFTRQNLPYFQGMPEVAWCFKIQRYNTQSITVRAENFQILFLEQIPDSLLFRSTSKSRSLPWHQSSSPSSSPFPWIHTCNSLVVNMTGWMITCEQTVQPWTDRTILGCFCWETETSNCCRCLPANQVVK